MTAITPVQLLLLAYIEVLGDTDGIDTELPEFVFLAKQGVLEHLRDLASSNLIDSVENRILTPRGRCFLEAVHALPLPRKISSWVMPDFVLPPVPNKA